MELSLDPTIFRCTRISRIKSKEENYAGSYAAISEAFAIFAKNEPDARFEFSAQHDILYAARGADSYSEEDKARLEELSCGYDVEFECNYINP